MRVLLADDDQDVAAYIRKELEHEAHTVSVCYDGATALREAQRHSFDVIILDVTMPHFDGVDVTRRLRREGIGIPIILLTARDAPEEIVRGLDAGADDYLTKPFSFDVLHARLRARTRRTPGGAQRLRVADLVLDLDAREAWRGARSLTLTRTEFALLECLVRAAGRVVSREHLIDQVWNDRDVSANNLQVFVRYLRAKVDRAGEPRLIHTERGLGYRLRSEPS